MFIFPFMLFYVLGSVISYYYKFFKDRYTMPIEDDEFD